MRGRLIVLDGIDGCGKSTQLNLLAEWLPTSGLMPSCADLIRTREPGGTGLGRDVRQLLLHTSSDVAPCATAELLLYAADRAQHVDTLIRPALERGDWVLSDRFSGSTLAYQGYGRGLDHDLIVQLEAIATADLHPDLTIWLSLPVAESMRRRSGTAEDRIEAEGRLFLERVSAGFAAVASQRGWCRVAADQSPSAVSVLLQRIVRDRLG
ncbi:MAG: dTMP kinase [Cyanobium sp. NAT70]|nr:dTMP kinase [Cyanobium sp. NAT70]|tara:strand:- start:361 stop:990 length:630 start_codon:yes stop_codon:yes gene_type:complete